MLSEYVALRMDVVMDVIDVGDGAGAVRHSKRMFGIFVAGNVADRWADIACEEVNGKWGTLWMAGRTYVCEAFGRVGVDDQDGDIL